MYKVSVESHFDAAHFLRNYKGKCENLHGHRYKVIANISTDKLNDEGLAYDFVELKRQLNNILDTFDHACLNDIPPFDKINPSAENISRTIYEKLAPELDKDINIVSIQVWESPENCVTYYPR
jgi:6-pyruvoyltetrahydropterin/6-carboxytetrahydropterin synthase